MSLSNRTTAYNLKLSGPWDWLRLPWAHLTPTRMVDGTANQIRSHTAFVVSFVETTVNLGILRIRGAAATVGASIEPRRGISLLPVNQF